MVRFDRLAASLEDICNFCLISKNCTFHYYIISKKPFLTVIAQTTH